jgi:hypothetical protein
VIFFERFQAPNYNEPTLANFASIYAGGRISSTVRNAAEGSMNHTYDGLYIQDKWRATRNLTLNGGIRWEWETWPSNALNTQWKNFDPRLGAAYKVGTKKNVVLRGGFGLFHGMIPAPLLACQIPSCGGTPNIAQLNNGKYPGRPFEDNLNAKTELFAFASSPFLTGFGMDQLLTSGTYPDATTISPFTGTTTGPSFGDCEIRPEPQKPVRYSGERGAGIRATARYDRKHQRTARSRRPPRELLQCESAGSEYEPHGGTADVSRLTRARRVKESLLHCRYSHEPVRL